MIPPITGPRTPPRRSTRLTGLIAAAALFACTTAHASQDPLRSDVELDQSTILASGTRTIYVRLSLEGIGSTSDKQIQRPPLNVSLVLDRSGSMADEGKMDYLKRAATLAVDRLDPKDTLSVIEYDDQISVLWPAQPVTNITELKSLIDKLEPRGSTNLAGGMMRGVEEAARPLAGKTDRESAITRVILMSDGLANTGVTKPHDIARLVSDARRKGIRISAMGLGRDYDEDLMQAIAENGGGRYYYIEHPSQMARIFQDELGSLFQTCARDVSLEFKGSVAIRSAEIVGYDEAKRGQSIRHGLEDIYEGEKRSILLRLEVNAPASGTLDIGTMALRYRSATSGETSAFERQLSVQTSSDASAVARSLNKSVAAEAALAESDRIQKEQVRLYQQGRHDEARRNLKALATDLEARNRDLADERLTRKIEALAVEQRQMETVAASPAEQKAYLKASKQRLYQAKSGKRTGFALQQGDKGREVTRLQEALRTAGTYTGPIDGIYDEDVSKAVKAYQKANGIKADGIAGASTMDRMGLY